jgi:hypothetical protein
MLSMASPPQAGMLGSARQKEVQGSLEIWNPLKADTLSG